MQHALILTFLFLGVTPSHARPAVSPNFVWLVSEDNSKHYLRLFDPHGAETPAIEKLAAQGLVFEHAFSNSPVCSVARTTLITGCYAPRIGTQYHRRTVMVPMPPGLRMFPAYLRDAGYYTTNERKKDYNAVEGEGVWDESSPTASWRKRRKGQSFFHMQSFPVTHESSLHFSVEDMQNIKNETDPATIHVAPHHPDTPTFRYTYARYHDRIRRMDAQVGAVVDKLEEDGLLEETFIFYFGDHGGVLPRSKGYAYESGLHVPLVVRVPAKWRHLVPWKSGARVSGFVSFVDFGPTLLHLAGLPVPKTVDGRPFLGSGVTAAEIERRDEAFGYADRFDEKYDLVRTLRKGRFEYVRSFEPFNADGLRNNYRYRMLAYAEWLRLYREGKLSAAQRQFFERRAPEALYDVEKDPYETRNLADDPEFADVVSALRARLAERLRGMPDLSLFPESVLVEEAFGAPTAYGATHKDRIARLLAVADLSLVAFAEAEPGLRAALDAEDPWQRYWAFIVLSAHGRAASSLVERAKELAASDPELLVRARAAEFLGVSGAIDPRPVILDVLKKSTDHVEVSLVLNILVSLRDGPMAYDFRLAPSDLGAIGQYVKRRLEYLRAYGSLREDPR